MVSAMGGRDGESTTLSTGETIDLPVSTEATITGAAFSASHRRVRELLPDGLSAVRVSPRRAAVTFLCVDYHRIGRRGAIEPYNEFGILVPTVPASVTPLPHRSMFTGGVGGYVWYLPVTTESAKALGVDIWGYPKEVGEITHEDDGSRRRTEVTVDGDRLVTIEIDRPPAFGRSVASTSYTVKDGVLLGERLELAGDLGAWPFSTAVRYTLGDHPRADRLREIGLGRRALVRFAGTVEFTIHAGEPV